MRHGFSLVELSIVLVILGLLTGGILSGQSLIRAAQLRSVVSEYQNFITATLSFRDKYRSLPGDFKDATKFWTAADGNDGIGADCFYTISTDAATCNGNGNGLIAYSTIVSMENFRYWQHLAAAGLIEGSYSGAPTTNPIAPSTRYGLVGTNMPRSKLGSTIGYYIHYSGYSDGTGPYWKGDNGHIYIMGGQETNDITEVPILPAEEMWNIDTKLDDGRPGYGKIRTTRTNASCVTDLSSADVSEYNVADTSLSCYLLMQTGF